MQNVDKLNVVMISVVVPTATTKTRESLLKGKAQYGWPPCINKFRSAHFHVERIIYNCCKTSYLMRRSTVLSLPIRLMFSTVDLLVSTNLDQLIFMLKELFTIVANKLRRSIVLSLSLQLVFPDVNIKLLCLLQSSLSGWGHTHKQTNKQTYKQTHIHTQTNKHTYKQTNTLTNKHTHSQTNKQTYTHTHTHTHTQELFPRTYG
jgi:hypothetical protein